MSASYKILAERLFLPVSNVGKVKGTVAEIPKYHDREIKQIHENGR